METVYWLISLVQHTLFIQMVKSQTGIYYDYTHRDYRYYQAIPCRVNNFYYNSLAASTSMTNNYTPRDNINCCYVASSRNDCCEETEYNYETKQLLSGCKCGATTTCGSMVTTPTTPTKPPPGKLFCPSLGPRILHSLAVTEECGKFGSVFPVVRKSPKPGMKATVLCNAVLAQAVVKGVRKTTLVTTQFCNKAVEFALLFKGDINIQVSPTLHIPMGRFNRIEGKDGAAFFDVNDLVIQQLTSRCNKVACGLKHPEMTSKIDYNDCQVLSYGSYDRNTLAQNGLRSIAVRIYPQGCRGIKFISGGGKGDELLTNAMCFATKALTTIECSGDYGAPVYCKTTSTSEYIVVGLLAASTGCGETTVFGVVQYPID